MKTKSVLLLILLAALLAIPAACGQTATPAATTTAAPATTAAAATEAATTAAAATEAAAPAQDSSEHMVFSFAYLGGDVSKDYNEDAVAQHFQQKFNFEWEIIPTNWSDWVEKTRVWVSAEDMPDLVFTDFQYKDYKSWIEQDLIKRFPANWKTTYPNLAYVYGQTNLGPALEGVIEGEQAVFPNIIFFKKPTTPKIAPHFSLYFRQDWAKALGFEIKDKYTLVEFEEIIDKFISDGSSLPDVETGKIDTWNLDTGRVSGVYMSSQWTNVGRFYKDDTGNYVWGPDDDRVFPMLQHMKEGIDKGYVSRNFASFQNEEQDDLFYAGQSFAIWSHGWVGPVFGNYSKFNKNTGLEALDCIYEAVLTDPDGNFQEVEQLNYWSCMIFSPQMNDAKFDRMLSLFDYVVTDEAQEWIRMGVEGKDWEKDGDGYKITREWDDEANNFKDLGSIYPGRGPYHSFLILGDDWAARDPAIPAEYHKVARTMYDTKQKFGVDTGTILDYNFETYFFDGPNYLKLSVNFGNEMVQLCMMDGDLRANFDNWLKERHAVIDPVLAELNAAYGSN